jgi:hypothetical protein
MTEPEYRKALDACIEDARGSNEQWNRRFVDALAAHKLKLVPIIDNGPPSKEYYRQAPRPYSIGQPFWPPSYIEEL